MCIVWWYGTAWHVQLQLIFTIDQLHVSNGILIDFIIKRDVTIGSPSCQRKCIAVYGELPIVEFEIPAVPQLKRTLCVRKKIGVVQSFPRRIAVV